MRHTNLTVTKLCCCVVVSAVGCAAPQRYRVPAPAEDQTSVLVEPLVGKAAGYGDAAKHLHGMEWVSKRTWHVLGLPYEREDYKGPPDPGGLEVGDEGAVITGTVVLGGVPVRNQVIACEIKQRDGPILVLLRSTDAFGEVLIELDLAAGTVRARSVTVSRSMIGGQSHSSPMPEQSSNRMLKAERFAPIGPGWHGLKLEARGERIALSLDGREAFTFDDPDPAGGKYGFGSTGSVAVRNVQQCELISPAEKQRREACLRDMKAFCRGLDAEYESDVRAKNRLEAPRGAIEWRWLPTGARARIDAEGTRGCHGNVTSGLYGNETLIDGAFPRIEVTAADGGVYRSTGAVELSGDAAGMRMTLELRDDAGNQASAQTAVDFTVLPVWWWTVTVRGVTPQRIQAFIGIAPQFAPKVAGSAKATKVPNIADASIGKKPIYYRHNNKNGVFFKAIMEDTVVGANVAGNGELVISTEGERLRFASMWLPAQPLNPIGFGKRMVHYIKYPEGPIQHWRRGPSFQEYPTNVDLARFAGHGCEAMVWHHTWIGNDSRDREGMMVNHAEMKRAMAETHRLGMAAIGYIGILPGRSALLRWEDATDNYAKNWDLQDFTFYSVAGRWQEFLPWMTDYWCREYGLDGYYGDGALAVPAWGKLKGPLNPEDIYMSLDEMQHRLYYRVKKVLERHGGRFGLEQWGGSADMLVTGFYDCRMIGESFQEAAPEDYRDGYNALITGTPFKMYGMRESSQNPYNIAMAAVCMSDIQVCSGNGAWGDVADTTETWGRVQPLWDLLESIDWGALVEARPWYAQELVSGEGFYAGNYTEPKRATIFLANKSEEAGTFDVHVDVSHLPKINGRWHARYVLGRTGDVGLLGDGRLKIELPALHDGPIGIELTAASR